MASIFRVQEKLQYATLINPKHMLHGVYLAAKASLQEDRTTIFIIAIKVELNQRPRYRPALCLRPKQ